MKKFLVTVLLGLFALSGQATLTSSATGGVTTLTDSFNGVSTQCAYMSFVNGNCVAATTQFADGYLQMAPGLLHTDSSASFSYDYGTKPNEVTVSFWYSTSLNHNAVFEFSGTTLVLNSTGTNLVNPGANSASLEQGFFSHTFQDVATGLHEMKFSTGNGNLRGLRVDDLSVTLAPVPEPETYAMLVAGLGLIAAAIKRRKAK